MMRRLGLGVALTCGLLVLPSLPAGAAQGPSGHGGDSVVGHGSFELDPVNFFRASIAARSGSNGEHSEGTMTFVARDVESMRATVRCVKVIGRDSLVTGDLGPHFAGGLNGMGFYIEDRTPLGLPDRIAVFFFSSQTFDLAEACRVLPFGPNSGVLTNVDAGDFMVRDT